MRLPLIYPAHAGINRTRVVPYRLGLHLPRTRGDKPLREFDGVIAPESTPHTRG